MHDGLTEAIDLATYTLINLSYSGAHHSSTLDTNWSASVLACTELEGRTSSTLPPERLRSSLMAAPFAFLRSGQDVLQLLEDLRAAAILGRPKHGERKPRAGPVQPSATRWVSPSTSNRYNSAGSRGAWAGHSV